MPFDAPLPTKPKLYELDPVLKRRWVDALRSDKYRQIRNILADGKDGRCVMGLYNEVCHGNANYDHLCDDDQFFAAQMPDGGSIAEHLAYRNDKGEPFASLADWIERNL